MKCVIIESPYRAEGPSEFRANEDYARLCLKDSLDRGEAPLASHLLYPQVLSDANPEERKLGMEVGWAWLLLADLVVVYTDRGITQGMEGGIGKAVKHGIEVERRQLWPDGEGKTRTGASQRLICP